MYFCADCLGHRKGKKKSHQICTVAEHSQMAGSGASAGKPVCTQHGKPLELFCQTCDIALCVQCSLDHKAPKCNTGMVEDLVGKNSQQLSGLVNTVERELPVLQKGVLKVDQVLSQLGINHNAVLGQVQKLFERHRETLKQREAMLIKELKAASDQKRKPLLKQKGTLEGTIAHIQTGAGYASRTISQASPGEVLQAKKMIAAGLEQLQRHGCVTEPECSPRITFVNNTPTLEDTLSYYGKVSGADTNPAICIATGPGLKLAVVGQPSTLLIRAIDWNRVQRTVGGDTVDVTLFPTHKAEEHTPLRGSVKDNGDGTYSCEYMASALQRYVQCVPLLSNCIYS